MSDQSAIVNAPGDPAATFRDVVRGIVDDPLERVQKHLTTTVDAAASGLRTDQRRLAQKIDELRQGTGEHAYTLPQLATALATIQQRLAAQDDTIRQATATAVERQDTATTTLVGQLDAHATQHNADTAAVRMAVVDSTRQVLSAVEALTVDVRLIDRHISVDRRLLVLAIGLMVLLAVAVAAIALTSR